MGVAVLFRHEMWVGGPHSLSFVTKIYSDRMINRALSIKPITRYVITKMGVGKEAELYSRRMKESECMKIISKHRHPNQLLCPLRIGTLDQIGCAILNVLISLCYQSWFLKENCRHLVRYF